MEWGARLVRQHSQHNRLTWPQKPSHNPNSHLLAVSLRGDSNGVEGRARGSLRGNLGARANRNKERADSLSQNGVVSPLPSPILWRRSGMTASFS